MKGLCPELGRVRATSADALAEVDSCDLSPAPQQRCHNGDITRIEIACHEQADTEGG
jgi:hypothetical protein